MAKDLSGRIMIGGIVAAAVALAVTAAVTSAYSQELALKGVMQQPAQAGIPGTWVPTIQNLKTGTKHEYKRATFPTKMACENAIQGLPEFLVWVNDANEIAPQPGEVQTGQVPEPPDTSKAEPAIRESIEQLLMYVLQNTGVFPRLGLTCDPKGDPA